MSSLRPTPVLLAWADLTAPATASPPTEPLCRTLRLWQPNCHSHRSTNTAARIVMFCLYGFGLSLGSFFLLQGGSRKSSSPLHFRCGDKQGLVKALISKGVCCDDSTVDLLLMVSAPFFMAAFSACYLGIPMMRKKHTKILTFLLK